MMDTMPERNIQYGADDYEAWCYMSGVPSCTDLVQIKVPVIFINSIIF